MWKESKHKDGVLYYRSNFHIEASLYTIILLIDIQKY